MVIVASKSDFVACEQQKCRPDCAVAQAGQHHCCSLIRKYNILTSFNQNFKILAIISVVPRLFEYYTVGNHGRQVFLWLVSYVYPCCTFLSKERSKKQDFISWKCTFKHVLIKRLDKIVFIMDVQPKKMNKICNPWAIFMIEKQHAEEKLILINPV